MSKKKIVLVVASIILALVIIVGVVCFLEFGKKTENITLDGTTSKVSKLCSELKEKQEYSFKTTLDEQNEIYYAKKSGAAYLDTNYQGKESKFIIKNGNSYLLLEDEKTYYTYQNNETDLEKIITQLEEIKDNQYIEGKEKIEKKEYKYEEYEGITKFLIKNVSTTEGKTAKTKFYFEGNNLAYIKTIVGDYEELLKVEISYNVDNKLFEIPADYVEM